MGPRRWRHIRRLRRPARRCLTTCSSGLLEGLGQVPVPAPASRRQLRQSGKLLEATRPPPAAATAGNHGHCDPASDDDADAGPAGVVDIDRARSRWPSAHPPARACCPRPAGHDRADCASRHDQTPVLVLRRVGIGATAARERSLTRQLSARRRRVTVTHTAASPGRTHPVADGLRMLSSSWGSEGGQARAHALPG